jgi:hypothetical protein
MLLLAAVLGDRQQRWWHSYQSINIRTYRYDYEEHTIVKKLCQSLLGNYAWRIPT